MAKVVWTEPALQDLDEIAEYIALDKLVAAKKLVKKIFEVTDNLEKFPKIGRKPPELRKTKYLELVVNPCRIFYRQDGEIVYILFVMRSERKLRNYILDDRNTKLS
jgi:toxin ParE1/3/4